MIFIIVMFCVNLSLGILTGIAAAALKDMIERCKIIAGMERKVRKYDKQDI